jgi:hypothetical protein
VSYVRYAFKFLFLYHARDLAKNKLTEIIFSYNQLLRMDVQYILGRRNFCAVEKDHQPDLKITPAAFAVELLQRINEITRLFSMLTPTVF